MTFSALAGNLPLSTLLLGFWLSLIVAGNIAWLCNQRQPAKWLILAAASPVVATVAWNLPVVSVVCGFVVVLTRRFPR